MQVLKPVCSHDYCHRDNECREIHDTACNSCGTSDKFCFKSERCISSSESSCVEKHSNVNNTRLSLSYAVVHVITHTAVIGRSVATPSSDNLIIRKGYILGFVSTAGSIASYMPPIDEAHAFSLSSYNSETTFAPGDVSPAGKSFSVIGVGIRKMDVKLYHTFQDPGNFTVNVTVVNGLTAMSSAQANITVYAPLNCSIEETQCSPSNETLTLIAEDNKCKLFIHVLLLLHSIYITCSCLSNEESYWFFLLKFGCFWLLCFKSHRQFI